MLETVFSKIVSGEIPAQKIYEDELTIAFLDINPVTRGHTLVIPKQAYDHIDDCPPELYAAIFSTVQKVSKRLRKVLQPQRVGLIVHGFEIPHAHVHVLPIYTPGDLKFPARPEPDPDVDALTKLAEQLQLNPT